MGRSPCCDKLGLKKGPWTPEEDQKLLAYIDEHGHGNWRALPSKAGLQRCGKSCRLRWTNYLRPDIKRGKFSLQEEQTIIQLHALLGNRWSAIATHLPKRTDNEIKNYWNTHLKKRLTKMGIDPVTHKPKNDALVPAAADCGSQQSKNVATLSHMAQWESARLEAEARLVRQSKLRSNASFISPPPGHHLQDQVLDPLSPPQPRCGLDVFKGHNWHTTSWPSNDSNHPQHNEGIGIGIGVGNGVAGVIGMDSPTSTLSFMGHGGVIEFMRHNNNHSSTNDATNHHTNYDQDDHRNNNQGLVKEEGDQWNNNPPLLSFNDMSLPIDHNQGGGTNKEIISGGDDDDDDRDDDEFDHENENRGFVEGFTNLLLSTTITTTTTTTTITADATRTSSSSGKSVQEDQGTYNSGSSGTTTSGSDDYEHEDNKLYWNNILNLVNSSPPHSPMF